MPPSRAPARRKKPRTLVSMIEEWYRDNPGMHRCQDVAVALGNRRIDTRRVAVESRRMSQRATDPLTRTVTGSVTLYGYPPPEETTP